MSARRPKADRKWDKKAAKHKRIATRLLLDLLTARTATPDLVPVRNHRVQDLCVRMPEAVLVRAPVEACFRTSTRREGA